MDVYYYTTDHVPVPVPNTVKEPMKTFFLCTNFDPVWNAASAPVVKFFSRVPSDR
jgi:hypothetical protein